MITIRQVRTEDWQLIKQIRLQALTDSPNAFLETVEEAMAMSDDEWLERTRQNALGLSSTCWLAFLDDRAVGIAAGLRDLGEDSSPPELVSMWVAPGARGKGLGRLLVEGVALWARQFGASEIRAEVTAENMQATEFYLGLGFRHTLTPPSPGGANVVLALPLRSEARVNEKAVREFVRAINEQDWHSLEKVVHPGFIRHSHAAGQTKIKSRNELISFLKSELETFPDGREILLDLLADGDRVAARHRFTGTQKGRMGSLPPSNKTLSAEYLAVYRLELGRIVEAWVEWDNLSSLKQLGHMPRGMI